MTVGTHATPFTVGIEPGETLRTAAQKMADHRVGLLVVEDGQKLRGVISDRDIALEVATGRLCADTATVRDVMSRPATVEAGAPLQEAIAVMRRQGVRRVPVLDRGPRAKGILAADDLLRLFAAELSGLADVVDAQGGALPPDGSLSWELQASDGLSTPHHLKPVLVAEQSASVAQACRDMKDWVVGCAVIVDAEGVAVGVLTDRDVALRVIAAGLDPSVTAVSAVMSQPVIAAESGTTIEALIRIMRDKAVRRVPIVENSRPVGIVTCDDLVETLGRELQALATAFARGRRDEWIAARVDRVRAEVSTKLGELAGQLGQIGDQALQRVADEVSALRERLGRSQH
jgi:CBS domain-containing protein